MNTTNDAPLPEVEATLRAEFNDRAGKATGAERILTALANQPLQLPARRKSPSIGHWATIAAAVAVIAAGVPIGLHLTGQDPQLGTTANPTPDASSLRQEATYGFTYTANWLPSGYVTSYRQGSVDGADQTWEWCAEGVTPQQCVSADIYRTDISFGQALTDQIRQATQFTDVNGHHAAVFSVPSTATVAWQDRPDTVIEVVAAGMPGPETIAEHLARSLTLASPADQASTSVGLSFGPLPTGYLPYAQAASGTPDRATRTIRAGDGAPDAARHDLTAQLVPSQSGSTLPEGVRTPVTIRGRAGGYVGGRDEAGVTVQLADGSWLTVTSNPETVPGRTTPVLTKDQLVAIADGMIIEPSPDLSWLGR